MENLVCEEVEKHMEHWRINMSAYMKDALEQSKMEMETRLLLQEQELKELHERLYRLTNNVGQHIEPMILETIRRLDLLEGRLKDLEKLKEQEEMKEQEEKLKEQEEKLKEQEEKLKEQEEIDRHHLVSFNIPLIPLGFMEGNRAPYDLQLVRFQQQLDVKVLTLGLAFVAMQVLVIAICK
jgi:hypothetical protein